MAQLSQRPCLEHLGENHERSLNAKVETIDKVEHDLLLQLPEGPTLYISPCVASWWRGRQLPIVVGTRIGIAKQTVASLAKLKAWGFDV